MYLPEADLEPTIAELERVSGGDLFASHSTVINLPKYVATGVRQPISAFNTRRMMLAKPRPQRLFTEFPPFGKYRWITL